jgi:hypothetical protein
MRAHSPLLRLLLSAILLLATPTSFLTSTSSVLLVHAGGPIDPPLAAASANSVPAPSAASGARAANQQPPPLKRGGAVRDLHAAVEAEAEAELIRARAQRHLAASRKAECMANSGAEAPESTAKSTVHSLLAHLYQLVWSEDVATSSTDATAGASAGSSSADAAPSSDTVWDHYSDESIWLLIAIGAVTLIVRDLLLR